MGLLGPLLIPKNQAEADGYTQVFTGALGNTMSGTQRAMSGANNYLYNQNKTAADSQAARNNNSDNTLYSDQPIGNCPECRKAKEKRGQKETMKGKVDAAGKAKLATFGGSTDGSNTLTTYGGQFNTVNTDPMSPYSIYDGKPEYFEGAQYTSGATQTTSASTGILGLGPQVSNTITNNFQPPAVPPGYPGSLTGLQPPTATSGDYFGPPSGAATTFQGATTNVVPPMATAPSTHFR